MEKLKLKEILLTYNLVIDNIGLDKYIDLIVANEITEISQATQAHHFIPVNYYQKKFKCKKRSRARGEAEQYAKDDTNNFLVNLKYTDHLKAHCYLALCAKEPGFKFANSNMLTVAKKDLTLEEFAELQNLDAYQTAYELLITQKHSQKLSDETKLKISEAHKKENMTAEYHEKLSAAMRERGKDPVYKQYISDCVTASNINNLDKLVARNKSHPPAKGLIGINNGITNTRIKPETLDDGINKGYRLGRKKFKNK